MRSNLYNKLGICLLVNFAYLIPSPISAKADPIPPSLTDVQVQIKALQQQLAELSSRVNEQQQTISNLNRENQLLKSSSQSSANSTSLVTSTQGARKTQFNPDIGVMGDIVATSSQSSEDSEGNDRISLREMAISFGHDIDPYARFDSIVTFSDEESPHIEEGYVTLFGLPYSTSARLGRFRPKIGIQSALHRDALETVDESLVVDRYLGHEGLMKTGIEIGNFLPFGWDNPTHQLTFGLLEGGTGHGGELLGETKRRPTFYARLRNSFELDDMNQLDIGGTYLRGSSDDDSSYEVSLYTADVSYVRNLPANRRLKLQSELFFQDRSEGLSTAPHAGHDHDEHQHASLLASEDHSEDEHEDEHHGEDDHLEDTDSEISDFRSSPFGMYALADYRFAQRFGVGFRYDYVQPVGRDDEYIRSAESAFNGMFTFYQSEFARWRLQYQYRNLLEGGHDNIFFLQGTFAIGHHSHSLQ
jgi:hypothetical protein